MVKLKISYTERSELPKLLQVLKPFIINSKKSQNREGEYKKAYATLDMNNERSPSELRESNS